MTELLAPTGRRRWSVTGLAVVAAVVAIGVGLVGDRSADEDRVTAPAPTPGPATAPHATAAPSTTRPDPFWVSPGGDDAAVGSHDRPFATVQHAMEQLRPGDRLVVADGVYRERVRLPGDVLVPGTADAPIVVEAAPGAQPVIVGLLWLTGADHWTLDGIDVRWGGTEGDAHMVQFLGGTGWRITNAELSGARAYSALNVDNGASDFRIDHLYVHDTVPTHDRNQDHLVYVASGNRGGVIERNVLVGSPNGRGIKVGPGSLDEPGSRGLVIRFNTLVDNRGPSNIRLSGDTSDVVIHHNLLVDSGDGQGAVTSFRLTGTGNVVRDNATWGSTGAVETSDGLADGGGNVVVDPRFRDPSAGDYRPLDPVAARYGAHAPAGD